MNVFAWVSPTNLVAEGTANVAVGDLIGTGENLHPHYPNIALSEDRAWICDSEKGADHVVPLHHCRPVRRTSHIGSFECS